MLPRYDNTAARVTRIFFGYCPSRRTSHSKALSNRLTTSIDAIGA